MESNEAPIIIQRDGQITRLILNRPRAINALTTEMIESGINALEQAARDGSRAIVISGAGDRGLCGGGDIKEMAREGATHAHEFIAREYVLDLMIAESPVPVVGFMDGITMGGGIGITGHAAVRIVTERSRLAMPETRIGIVPDVGGHLLLARAPGRLGEYLAVTSQSMDAGDAIALGFADFFVPSDRLEPLATALAERAQGIEDIRATVQSFAEEAPASQLLAARGRIDELFTGVLSGDTQDLAAWATGAAVRLVQEAETRDHELAAALREVSPTSVAVTLAQIERTRSLGLTLEEVLRDDLRVLTRLFSGDFVEGVRARVIDKDNAPAWNPARIEDLDVANIAEILAPASGDVTSLAPQVDGVRADRPR